ncbi:MAG: Ig-like domain-containing protein, partial [Spirochaetales bacterium]|nr:Ig-like domain-containing protein [Spirochaetales bacterium]
TEKTVTIDNFETGATLYYSTNGGASETKINSGTTFRTPNSSGTYQITVRQTDIAGNKSPWANSVAITVDTTPPTIKSISTTKSNGTYGVGEKITITAECSEPVKGSLTISLNSGKTVTLTFPNSYATTATATYTVASGQNTPSGVYLKASDVTGSITDAAGNTTSSPSIGSITNFSGKSIVIDTTAPALSSYKVYKYTSTNTTSTDSLTTVSQFTEPTPNVNADKPITLTFNENVIKGSGTIKIERVYKSYPAVLSADDWQSISNATVKGLYIQRCIGTVNNDGVTPDTNAKYVLKYEIDHQAWNTTPSGTNEKEVYDYFKDLDYNVMTLDITSGLITVSGQNVTITPSSALANGIVYKVVISEGAFIDAAGNSCETDNSVQFETGPTATPVIRINKLSGKEGGSQPTSTGVKISTETYGGTIYYQSKYKETASDTEIINVSQVTNPYPATTGTTDKYTATLSNTSTSAAIFKLYAKTVKDNLTTTDNNITKELAFKTVIIGGSYGFRGSDSTGGVSATTEFPLNWYDTPNTAQSDGNKMYSWHILKDFQAKSMKGSDDWLSVGAANTACYVGNYNVTALTYTLNVLDYTFNDSAEVSIWAWDERNNGDWYDVTKVNDTQGTVVVAKGLSKFKLVRCSSNHPHDWNNVWNQTGDITITSATTYTATF